MAWYKPSYATATLTVEVAIETEITLTLQPAIVEPGATYHYVGILSRVDTGAGLEGMEVIAKRYSEAVDRWLEVGRGTTTSYGAYDIAATAPTAEGTFGCRIEFPGVTPFGATYATKNLGVGIIPVPLVWTLAPASIGAILLIAGR